MSLVIAVTIFIICHGGYSPKTKLGRRIFVPMAIGAILSIGLVVASMSSLA